MSDLAPFVAATLRDKVVSDQKKEIDGLKEKLGASEARNAQLRDQLLYQNPIKQVGIVGPDGTPLVSSTHNILHMSDYTEMFPNNEDVCITFADFLQLELHVDNYILPLCEMQLSVNKYMFCGTTLARFMVVECSGHGFRLCCYVAPMPDTQEYVQLTGVTEDKFVSQTVCPNAPAGEQIFDHVTRPVSFAQINQEFMQQKMVKIPFDDGECICNPDLFRSPIGRITV